MKMGRTAGAAAAGMTVVATVLAAGPGVASASLADKLPDVQMRLDTAELTTAAEGSDTAVAFAPPAGPVNTTCYGPYVYVGELDSKVKEIVQGFIERKQQGDGDSGTGDSGTGDSGTGDSGTGDAGTGDTGGTGDAGTGGEPAPAAALADAPAADAPAAEDDPLADDDTASKVSPIDPDAVTRVDPGARNTLDYALGGGAYTALGTCISGGTVPGGDATPEQGQDGAGDADPSVHATVYLRAVNYEFGVVGQMLGSLDTGSVGSLADLFG
ncbi:hypothetical protein [Tomitella fengzijianii]|uniref:Uncharacterized protein n=1 Tax=Tomitella fengzijianii TaxID=2597660 RepID=A0A516X633_9ACTN|nr:hypothetical protein [Tomitella fengzijianii]QDQ98500.1 hypothetical protein FO059_15715 [Tomitella fengzijianii]